MADGSKALRASCCVACKSFSSWAFRLRERSKSAFVEERASSKVERRVSRSLWETRRRVRSSVSFLLRARRSFSRVSDGRVSGEVVSSASESSRSPVANSIDCWNS